MKQQLSRNEFVHSHHWIFSGVQWGGNDDLHVCMSNCSLEAFQHLPPYRNPCLLGKSSNVTKTMQGLEASSVSFLGCLCPRTLLSQLQNSYWQREQRGSKALNKWKLLECLTLDFGKSCTKETAPIKKRFAIYPQVEALYTTLANSGSSLYKHSVGSQFNTLASIVSSFNKYIPLGSGLSMLSSRSKANFHVWKTKWNEFSSVNYSKVGVGRKQTLMLW